MKATLALVVGILLGGSAVWLRDRSSVAAHPAVKAVLNPPPPVIAAAQGRVEGRSENMEVEASTDGIIKQLFVSEGQAVSKGQVLAALACEDLESQARASKASLESARESRLRVLRGSRDEERRVAEQEVKAAQAVAEQARRQSERMQHLASKGTVPRILAETAQRDSDCADAALTAALARQKLVDVGPLPEEISKAEADVRTAAWRLRAASAQRDKCLIRSPINGTVVRINLRAGKAFSTIAPRAIVTLADLSEQRVRTEIDERDLDKIHPNQRVRITAEGFSQRFGGKVAWTSLMMGRKTARSTDPADKSDRDILETIVVPDRGTPQLPIGLRVVVEFLPN